MRLAHLIAVLALLPFVPSCTSEAAGPAGVYTMRVDTSGMPDEQAKAADAVMGMMKGELTLKPDNTLTGSMTMGAEMQTVQGTWKLDGANITLTMKGEGQEQETMTGTYDDGVIRITQDKMGQKVTMLLEKKDK